MKTELSLANKTLLHEALTETWKHFNEIGMRKEAIETRHLIENLVEQMHRKEIDIETELSAETYDAVTSNLRERINTLFEKAMNDASIDKAKSHYFDWLQGSLLLGSFKVR